MINQKAYEVADIKNRRIGTAQAQTRGSMYGSFKHKQNNDNITQAQKTITDKWADFGELKNKHSSDLRRILNNNHNEYQPHNYINNRGLSNKNISTVSKVKRISTKYLREKDKLPVPKYQHLCNTRTKDFSDYSIKMANQNKNFQEIFLSQNLYQQKRSNPPLNFNKKQGKSP